MADMAQRWGRAGVRVHVVSRHGLLPLPHAAAPAPPHPAPRAAPTAPLTLAAGPAARVRRRSARPAATGAAAIDGLRPVTDAAVAPHGRRRACRTSCAPPPGAGTACGTGSTRRCDAWLRAAMRRRLADRPHRQRRPARSETARGLRVDARATARSSTPRWCSTAPARCVPVQLDEDPLVLNLLDAGLARSGSLDLGFATDAHGRVLPADGAAAGRVWAVGPLRRGELWESTADPRDPRRRPPTSRSRSWRRCPAPDLRRRPRDPYGLPLVGERRRGARRTSTGSAGSCACSPAPTERFDRGGRGSTPTSRSGTPRWPCSAPSGAPTSTSRAALRRRSARAAARRRARAALRRRRRPRGCAEPGRGVGGGAAVLHPGLSRGRAGGQRRRADDRVRRRHRDARPRRGRWSTAWPRRTATTGGTAGLLAFFRQEQERYDEAARAGRPRARGRARGGSRGARARARALRDRRSPRRAGLAGRLDPHLRRAGRRTARTSPGTPRCTNWRSATTAPRSERYARAAAAADGHRRAGAGRLGRRCCGAGWYLQRLGPASTSAAVLAAVPESLLSAPPTPFVGAARGGRAGRGRRLRRTGPAAPVRAAPRRRVRSATTIAPLCDALADLVHGDADRATDGLLRLHGRRAARRQCGAARDRRGHRSIHAAELAGRPDVARRCLQDRLRRRPSPRDEGRCAQLSAHEAERA